MADVVMGGSLAGGALPAVDGMGILELEDMTCKGCGDILEEGKAFELAGNRWHIDCFRCTTCRQPLDSDANLLLLGDGSLLCNNCTYNCAACGNKIEDLAILTGDQAFCSTCFKCRNCKRDIENLRYARTSQGIFCMDCHQKLMTRRRKKKQEAREEKLRLEGGSSGSSQPVDKTLPALPPKTPQSAAFNIGPNSNDSNNSSNNSKGTPASTKLDTSPASEKTPVPAERPQLPRVSSATNTFEPLKRNNSTTSNQDGLKLHQTVSSSNYSEIESSKMSEEDFFIPIAIDHSPGPYGPPTVRSTTENGLSPDHNGRQALKDYFGSQSASQSRSSSTERVRTPHIASFEKDRQSSTDMAEILKKRLDRSVSPAPSPSPSPGPPMSKPPQLAPSNPPDRSRSRPLMNSPEPPESQKKFELAAARPKQPIVKQPIVPAPIPTANNGVAKPNGLHHSGSEHPSPKADSAIATSRSSKESANSSPVIPPPQQFERPQREDSFKNNIIPRKELPGQSHELSGGDVTPKSSVNRPFAPKPLANSKDLSYPMRAPEIPGTRLISDEPPLRSPLRKPGAPIDNDAVEMLGSIPSLRQQEVLPNKSSTSVASDQADLRDSTTALPSFVDGSLDDEGSRPGTGDQDAGNLLRKMSKAVKHGRSQSDRMSMTSPGKVRNGRSGSVDIGSPTHVTPDSKEDAMALRSKLRYAQQRISDLEAEKSSLEEKVSGAVNIRQVSLELQERRFTVARLAAQQEMVSRELELMTEYIKKARDSNEPVDIEQLKSDVLKDFALSLHKLKDDLGVQIEELVVKRNDLSNEISSLIEIKNKGFQEYESLSSKNQQLNDLNSQLVTNIQEMHRTGRSTPINMGANGLGIYGGNDRPGSESGFLSGDMDGDATILSAPKVIDIRKGQGKKFNWKKGRTLTSGLKQGFKDTFSTEKSNFPRDEQFAETAPYSSLQAGETPVSGPLPLNGKGGPVSGKEGWSFLSSQREKGANSGKGANNAAANGIGAGAMFGSDLTQRCEFERRVVPTIVTRCIEEVELRGIDAEGIYRKSGSSLQVKQLQQGFEKDPSGFDISDQDLDIHAVTSCLKQYFRKLPVPLITFEVYDMLIDQAQALLQLSTPTNSSISLSTTGSSVARDEAFLGIRNAIDRLPRCHRDTLEFLVFHLVRVMSREGENLMTPLNISVVFAPTIMRPLSIEREMTDMHAQRVVVQTLLEQHNTVFGGEDSTPQTATATSFNSTNTSTNDLLLSKGNSKS